MRKRIFLILIVAAVVALCSCSRSTKADYRVLRLRDNAEITFSTMIEDLKGVDFIFVGEVHDSMENHRVQLRVIEALYSAKCPLQVGLEMFKAKSQPKIDEWQAGKISNSDFIRIYYGNWKLPWPLYRDIFYYLKEKKIPMLGLNIPASVSKKVAGNGAASLTEAERAELPPGLSCDVSPAYRNYIEEVFSEHAAGRGEKSFQNFCEAQVLWDMVMAWHLVQDQKKDPVTTVVLCGLVHALKRGIPSRVENMREGSTFKIILPGTKGLNMEAITPKLADYIVLDE